MKIQTKFAICHIVLKGKGLVGLIGLQSRPPAKASQYYIKKNEKSSKYKQKTAQMGGICSPSVRLRHANVRGKYSLSA